MRGLIFCLATCWAELKYPQFSNPVYPGYKYTGSRILETNYLSNVYAEVDWYQSATINEGGSVYLAHTSRHSIILIPPNSTYYSFSGLGSVYSGRSGVADYVDGTLASARFNSPKGVAIYKKYLFVADTGNHLIRRIDIEYGRVITIAGVPGTPGLLDGDGRKALFKQPTSLGIDQKSGTLYVLDNLGKVRVVEIQEEYGTMSVQVSTLVHGACRAVDSTTTFQTIIKRTVRCMTDWVTTSRGSDISVPAWAWSNFCLGNSLTCSTRYDRF
jgi:hypothetical protein